MTLRCYCPPFSGVDLKAYNKEGQEITEKVFAKNQIMKVDADYTGAMGTRAKLMAEEAKIRVDFTYGVIDKCILKALAGKSCLVLTSQGMMGQVQKRIEAYSQQSGEEINSVDLSSGSNGRSLPIDRDFVGTKSLK